MFSHDVLNRFQSRDMEKTFRIFYMSQNRNIAKFSLPLYVFCQLLISTSEVFLDRHNRESEDGGLTVFFRLAIVVVTLGSLFVILKESVSFQKYRYKVLQSSLCLIGLLLLAMQYTVSLHSTTHGYMFYAGQWSLADSIVFVLLCFNCSGMLFADVAWICSSYILTCTMLPHFLFFNTVPIDRLDIFVLPILLIFELSYLNDYECEMRGRYVSHLQAGQALTRQDKLINSILPTDISNALKLNQFDKLMNYYPAVTILFCYIVDFTQQACANPSKDTVALCFRIVSVLDHIVEQTGAYKVENIADTYMACAGCPTEREDNASIMAHTAIAMIQASHRYNWRWPDGTPVELKIGLHSGSATAGVVGTKSYSFHLFGDSVNTASRMCSNSSPGRILMSARCHNRLTRDGNDMFITEERGPVAIKGKGMMNLFWLNSHKEKQKKKFVWNLCAKRSYPDKALLERFDNLRESSSAKIVVSRRTLRFQLQSDETRTQRDTSRRMTASGNALQLARAVTRSLTGGRAGGGVVRMMSSQTLQEHFEQEDSQVTGFDTSVVIGEGRLHPQSSDIDRSQRQLDRRETAQSDYDYKPSPVFEENEEVADYSPEKIRQLKKTVVDMETAFMRENDWKVLPQQRKYLWAAFFFTLGTYVYYVKDTHDAEWLLLCAVLIAVLGLYLTKFTSCGIRFSQLAITLTVATVGMTIRIRVTLYDDNGGSQTNSAVIYSLAIIFLVIFFRLRSHYLVCCMIGCSILWILLRNMLLMESSESDNAYGVSCLLISLFVSVVREYSARVDYATSYILDQETKKSRDLLSNMLPRRENAQALLNGEFVCEELKNVTLLYSDMKGFTEYASNKHPLQLAKLLDSIYTSFDRHLNHFGLYKIDIIGDAFVVVGGIAGRCPVKSPTLNCVQFAFHMLHDLKEINGQYGSNLELRIGIHTGDVVGSVISLNKPRYLIWGASTIIANYMESSGKAGLVNVSWEAMQKLDILELNMLNIHIPNTVLLESDFDSLPQDTSYLLSCNDISEFIHDAGADTETTQEHQEHQSLLSTAYRRLKRLSVSRRVASLMTLENHFPDSSTCPEPNSPFRKREGDELSQSFRLRSTSDPGSPSRAKHSPVDGDHPSSPSGLMGGGHFPFTEVENNRLSPSHVVGKHLEEKIFPKNVELDHTGGAEFVFETHLRAVTISMPGDWAQYGTQSKAADDGAWGYF